MAWAACLFGAALALELVVLAVDVGPLSVGLAAMIGASAAVAVAGAVSFWRLVGRGRGRPRLAGVLLLVAVAWAGLSAFVMAWLFAAFNP